MLEDAITQLKQNESLSAKMMQEAMESIMSGHAEHGDMISFLTGLRDKGETVTEIAAAARVMRQHAVQCKDLPDGIVDTCGTGGDQKGSFNISTAAAFVVAGAGVPVAKHGNRSVSSKSGSADVLEALGAAIDLGPEAVAACLKRVGIGFFYAPRYHPAMKHVMAARREIGTRTIFNLLGPLSNPAGTRRQLLGVYAASWCSPMAEVLADLGAERVMVVHGSDGMDEITLTATTEVVSYNDGTFDRFTIDPVELGLQRCQPEDLLGTDAAGNARQLRAVLEGFESPLTDAVRLNAAAALVVAERAANLHDGLEIAAKSLHQGHAMEKLHQFVDVSNELSG